MPARVTDPSLTAHALLDLAAAARNARRIRSRMTEARIMAVIKANGYGHGLLRMARALADDVDGFAVARTAEGLSLREAGIALPVTVLQGFINRDELLAQAANRLEPVIHSGWQADLLGQTSLPRPLRIWLKLDTGMHRLGLLPDEFQPCLDALSALPHVAKPIPVMTHFANADELDDPYTEIQLGVFRDKVGTNLHETSAANSAGMLRWEKAHMPWVRPGITLYGVSPFAGRSGPDEGLEPVMTLRSRLISIKTVEAGARVGYGSGWVCDRPTRLGVAAIGYGDGYPRHAPPGTPVLIHGQRLPLAGRVSMDMITIDVTDCPAAGVGDAVTLWGKDLPVEDIAARSGTIPYELLCGVTARVNMIEV